VLYVNSYHDGYPPSDEVMEALIESLPADSFDVKIMFLNSKLQSSNHSIRVKADSVLEMIGVFKPNVLAISDDNAMKYLVEPYAANLKIPVVFCGINWSADQYRFSKSQVTGMLEVLPLKSAIQALKEIYPQSKTIAVISENSLSEKNNTTLLDTLYRNAGLLPEYYLVDSFPSWKKAFLEASAKSDLIYLPTNGAIKGWNDDEAKDFVFARITKPVFTCDEFMMPYCVTGFTKIPAEQGQWVAQTIKKILGGAKISDIPQSRNVGSKIFVNHKLAGKIGLETDKQIFQNANKY
jgi:ABC-type uncharacterized transport system substrate-binding protein